MTTDDPNAVPLAKPAAPVEPAGFEVTVDVTEHMQLQAIRQLLLGRFFRYVVIASFCATFGVLQLVTGSGRDPLFYLILAPVLVALAFVSYHAGRAQLRQKYRRIGDSRKQYAFSEEGVTVHSYRLQEQKAGDCRAFAKLYWPEMLMLWKGRRFWMLFLDRVNFFLLPMASLSPEQQAFIEGHAYAGGLRVIKSNSVERFVRF